MHNMHASKSRSHLLVVCINVERLALKLELGHLVPVREGKCRETGSLNIHEKYLKIT